MRKATAIFAAIVMVVLLMVGCEQSPIPSVLKQQVELTSVPLIEFDATNTQTIGNNTYIAINQYGRPDDNVSLILNVLKMFETEHPNLQVLDWKIEKRQYTSGGTDSIFGLWIHHRQKQE